MVKILDKAMNKESNQMLKVKNNQKNGPLTKKQSY